MLNTHTMNDNKLISEFMGITGEYNEDEKVVYLDSDIDGKGIYAFSDMKYHTSWDWLMPVLRNISVTAELYELPEDSNLIEDITNGLVSIDIEMTFEAVVEFIKAKNNQDAEKNKLI